MPLPWCCTRLTCGHGAKPGSTGCSQASRSMSWFRSSVHSGGFFAAGTPRSRKHPRISVSAILDSNPGRHRPVAPHRSPSVEYRSCSHVRTDPRRPIGLQAPCDRAPHRHSQGNARQINTTRLTPPCCTADNAARQLLHVNGSCSFCRQAISTNTSVLNAEPQPAQRRKVLRQKVDCSPRNHSCRNPVPDGRFGAYAHA